MLAAPPALMQQYLFAIAPHDLANWLHRRMAVALAITGHVRIYMPTPEAVRAVIPMPAARNGCAYELLAVHTSERLVGL